MQTTTNNLHLSRKLINLLVLIVLLALNSCKCGCKPPPHREEVEKSEEAEKFDETIIFIGESGVGKSSLCNAIFQKKVFKSGLVGPRTFSLTPSNQEYVHENKRYIDTSITSLESNIKQALKEKGKYKIVFVNTLSACKLYPAQRDIINKVCDAIKVPFEYGIVFNKLSPVAANRVGTDPMVGIPDFNTDLTKKPKLCVFIRNDTNLEDANDVYLPANSDDRKKLVEFITNLNATVIAPSDVQF